MKLEKLKMLRFKDARSPNHIPIRQRLIKSIFKKVLMMVQCHSRIDINDDLGIGSGILTKSIKFST